jgi:hypothetical protein
MLTVQPLPDGRFNIVLQGLRRFEVKGETGAESYRLGQIELKDFVQSETELPSKIRTDFRRVVTEFLKSRKDEDTVTYLLKQPLRDETLVHNLSYGLDFTPLEKQFLLESDSLVQQARRLLDLLQFKLYERNDQAGWG